MSDIRKFSGYTATIDGTKHATLKEAEAHTIAVKTGAALAQFAELTADEPSKTVFKDDNSNVVILVQDLPKFLATYKEDILKAFAQVARTRKARGPNKPKAAAVADIKAGEAVAA
jgi:hypothetical protein